MHGQRVSLRDVGAHLGLNESTVSRALSGHPGIPPPTRERVRRACAELGYRPNSLVTELASTRWQAKKVAKGISIAYIDRTRTGDSTGPAGVMIPLQEQAALLGYEVSIFKLEQLGGSLQLHRILRHRGITDLVLGPCFDAPIELDWERLICVQMLPGNFPLPFHSVVRDQFNSIVFAWRKAAAYGYRRIGLVLLDHGIGLMDDIVRWSAAKACQEQIFPKMAALPIFRYGKSDEREDAFVKWVRREEPDAIIGFSGSHLVIYRAQFKREIPFISLHTDGNYLTGIRADEDESAREAINLLHFCRRTHQWGIPKNRIDHVMEPRWFEGQTLPRKVDVGRGERGAGENGDSHR